MYRMNPTYRTSVDAGHSHTVYVPNAVGAVSLGQRWGIPDSITYGVDQPPLQHDGTRQNGGSGGSGGQSEEGWRAKARRWWSERTKIEKGAVVVGGLASFGLLVLAFTGAPKRMRSNLSRKTRKQLADKKPGERIEIGRKRYEVGKIVDVKGGRRFGHKIPPKKYRQKGARRPSDYAWPEGYKYPLVFRDASGKVKPELTRKHVRAAASYYGRYKDSYPPKVRRTIHRNINRARKRFGVGEGPLAY